MEGLLASAREAPVALNDVLSDAPVVRRPSYRFVKRAVDVVVAAAFLAILCPFLLPVAIAIKLSGSGPVFYKWDVIGRNGRPFTGYKLRTMVENADRQKAELLHLNEMRGPVFKMHSDPRITDVGRVLRKFSIDELPQLWSVLRGEMTLVGPRPAGPEEWKRYEPWQRRRLTVTPGITCLWQVKGRNRISDFGDWVRLDLQYIDQWTLWLDFRIILQTVIVVLKGTGQ